MRERRKRKRERRERRRRERKRVVVHPTSCISQTDSESQAGWRARRA